MLQQESRWQTCWQNLWMKHSFWNIERRWWDGENNHLVNEQGGMRGCEDIHTWQCVHNRSYLAMRVRAMHVPPCSITTISHWWEKPRKTAPTGLADRFGAHSDLMNRQKWHHGWWRWRASRYEETDIFQTRFRNIVYNCTYRMEALMIHLRRV